MMQTAQQIKKDNELFLQNKMQSTDVSVRYFQVFLQEIVISWTSLRFTETENTRFMSSYESALVWS